MYRAGSEQKAAAQGRQFVRLRQKQLCSLWPHLAIPKPWKTSLAAATVTVKERKCNCEMVVPKPRDTISLHIHLPLQNTAQHLPVLHPLPSPILSLAAAASTRLNSPTTRGNLALAPV